MLSEVCVVVALQGKPETGGAIADALQRCVGPSRAEVGCHFYTTYRDNDHPDRVWVIERWASREAIDRHNQTAHFLGLGAELAPLLSEPAQLSMLSAVDE